MIKSNYTPTCIFSFPKWWNPDHWDIFSNWIWNYS